ncbi:hypothetical protein F5Y15DRAFT_428838 [Xylariaceae sp. FL0016]|nr:hypothetical protein F5Y15DRAFT_428838 [Xylariaceae sp. FL0016]
MSLHTTEGRRLLTDYDGKNDSNDIYNAKTSRPLKSLAQRLMIGALVISLVLNLYMAFTHFFYDSTTVREPLSAFANMKRNREEPFVVVTPYSSDNETLQDQLWHDINVDAAVIALSDEWASEHNLRAAQRFPWDQTKGIYILHGYHNLHCLKIVYLSLSEYRRRVPQTRSWHHISHCMDALRRQILCDADDTPRATDHRAEVMSGVWQHRKCRTWDDLEAFAKRHTACYKRPENPDAGGDLILERFKHCPPGSGYTVTNEYVSPDKFIVGLPAESLEEE